MRVKSLLLALCCVVLQGLATTAKAQGSGRRVVAVVTEGDVAAKLRQQIAAALGKSADLAEEKGTLEALVQAGIGRDLGKRINDASQRGPFFEQLVTLAKSKGWAGVILARHLDARDTTWIVILNGQTGEVLLDRDVTTPERGGGKGKRGKKRPSVVDLSLVGTAISVLIDKLPSLGVAAAPAATAASTPATTPAAKETQWGDSAKQSTADRLLGGSSKSSSGTTTTPTESSTTKMSVPEPTRAVTANNARVLVRPVYAATGRRYTYNDRRTDNLRPYKAFGVSMLGFEADIYPGAIAGVKAAADIGLMLGYRQTVGLKSAPKDDSSNEIGTSWSELDLALRYRLNLESLQLGANLGYGKQAFTFDVAASDPMKDQVPEVSYGFLRIGLDARAALGPVHGLFAVAYRHVLGVGKVKDDYFPEDKVTAFDLLAGASYPLMKHLEAFGALYYTRYGHVFTVKETDEYVAKGAADQYYGLRLGAQLYF